MQFETLSRRNQQLTLESEVEIRAASLSFDALARAVKGDGDLLGGSWLKRTRDKRRLAYLDEHSSSLFASNALSRLMHTDSFEDEGQEADLIVRGARDLSLLRTGARLLLQKELQTIAFFNEQGFAMTETQHQFGPDFIPTLRKMNSKLNRISPGSRSLRHPLTAPETYAYERHDDSVWALHKQHEVVLGIQYVRSFNIPFLPAKWKEAIHEVRMRRAEVKAAANADDTVKALSGPYYYALV